jgi:hypothetical protein
MPNDDHSDRSRVQVALWLATAPANDPQKGPSLQM